jgi:hypothetical protein
MNTEKIEHKGFVYEITTTGLISEPYRKRNAKSDLWSIGEQPPESEVNLCVEWLEKYATPRKTPNPNTGSYGLKHIIEKWAGTYISNGAFILAAYRMGYRVIPEEPLSPNALVCLNFPKDQRP